MQFAGKSLMMYSGGESSEYVRLTVAMSETNKMMKTTRKKFADINSLPEPSLWRVAVVYNTMRVLYNMQRTQWVQQRLMKVGLAIILTNHLNKTIMFSIYNIFRETKLKSKQFLNRQITWFIKSIHNFEDMVLYFALYKSYNSE